MLYVGMRVEMWGATEYNARLWHAGCDGLMVLTNCLLEDIKISENMCDL